MKIKNGRLGYFFNKLGERTDLLSFQQFSFEMNSEEAICIHGCKDIAEYDNNKIVISTEKFLIAVFGEQLEVETFSSSFTTISGNISGIEFRKI